MKCFGCSKYIVSKKYCSLCENLFCSDSCVEAHKITYHRINKSLVGSTNLNQPILVQTPLINSKYITEGEIFQKIEYNKIYNLNNFVQIMSKHNKPYILGSGSYGQVYLCKNILNNKYYAIKHMDKSRLKKSLKTLSGIYTEIDLQSRISHPNIVQLLYVNESKTKFDLVMEYASKGSLFDFIRKNRRLSEELSFSIFIQVVNAVYFLHRNDLIHRDIKPENLLLFNNNLVKLCDFGWCVSLNGGQRGTFCGTTEYMAPEMVNKKEYSKEIDIWRLGVLLYEIVHGHSPFIPKKVTFNEKEVMENIKIHNLKFDSKISNECRELICHLLDENRHKRYKIEDIFNSDFVKKNDNIINNNNKTIEEYENNIHSKCISQIDYSNKPELNKETQINNNNKKNNNNEFTNNKTANNFYPKNYNDINIDLSKKIEINDINNNSPKNISRDKFNLIPKRKVSVKIKNNDRKIGFKIFDKAIEYLNIKEAKQKNNINTNIIDSDIKETFKDRKNNHNANTRNYKKFEEENLNSNYSISEGNNSNILAMIKKHPVNSGNSMINNINNNKNSININKNCVKDNKIINIINKNGNAGKIKNKSIISYKSNGEYLISPKNNTPIIIKAPNNSNKSNKNNIKQKQKIFIKNNSSDTFMVNKENSNQNNKTQMIEIKSNNLLNENSKMRYYSDINYNSFKDTPDPEFFIPINNYNKNGHKNISDSKNDSNMKDNNEGRVYQNFNYLIINNSNNIISSSLNQEQQNERKEINKDNNIIIYPYHKMSKTPIKNKERQKQTIKMDKKTIDYENDSKVGNHHKIRVKSKSQIKNIPDNKNIFDLKIKNKQEQKNNIIMIQNHKKENNIRNNFLYNPDRKVENISLDTILDENTLNINTINNKGKDSKENNIELKKIFELNHVKKEKNEIKRLKISNNSFSGGKIIPKIKIENNNKMNSPFKIKNYNLKPNSKDPKKDANATMSEYSKIIDQREYDVEDNEEDELQSTPKKTTDKLKIFPCKLISELTKKFS